MVNKTKFPIMGVGRLTEPYLSSNLLYHLKNCGCTVAEATIYGEEPTNPPTDVNVSSYPSATERNIARSLHYAAQNGMDVMVRISDPGRDALATSAESSTAWAERWQRFVSKFKNHPNVYGWMLFDQPGIPAMKAVANCASVIKAEESKTEESKSVSTEQHPVYVDLFPPFANDSQMFGTGGTKIDIGLYNLYCEQTRDILNPDIWSNPNYAMTIVGSEAKVRENYFRNLLSLHTASVMSGKPYWAYVQTSQPNTATASVTEEAMLRFQIYSALACGAKGLVYHNMTGDATTNAPLMPLSNGLAKTTPSYSALQNIYKALKDDLDLFLKFTLTDIRIVNHQGNSIYDTIAPWSKTFPTVVSVKVTDNKELILSRFAYEDEEMFMVVNPDLENAVEVTISFNLNRDMPQIGGLTPGIGQFPPVITPPIRPMSADSSSGLPKPVYVSTQTITLQPGEGAILKSIQNQ